MNFEDLTRKVKKFSKDTVEEVQRMNEVRQLNSKVNEASKQINALYAEIGKKLYELYKSVPLEGFEAEIQAITDKEEFIQDMQEQILVVKGVTICPSCGMEVGIEERFCSNCGSKMPMDIVEEEPVYEDNAADMDALEEEDFDDAEDEFEAPEDEFEAAEDEYEEEPVEDAVEDAAELTEEEL